MQGKPQDPHIDVAEWIANTSTSSSRLYAVLASTNGAAGLKAYYKLDGRRTPDGLYAGTPYANWYPVMPMLVELSPYSAFLSWVKNQAEPGWGWLALSPLPEETIVQHLTGLTQVFMPNGQTVFFRYWDERYFRPHLEFLGDDWRYVLPVFSNYWVAGKTFTFTLPADYPLRSSPWWHVPQPLLSQILAENPAPLVHNLMQLLRENHPEIYSAMPEPLLRRKAEQLCRYSNLHSGQIDQLMAALLASMTS
ncbi:DUF4123 domain-containing protein [Hafnia alvei]|uniref:DUF4123 domain-containing protein n=1 Tax=Hafnia alvei TaxID=569 RepID=UPI00103347B8|nr:DUF4123 domain-containing protein [Hafnia alvei]TBL89522.1 DUF4123 domain-containing protein [Hafnia alvei]